MYCSFSSTKQCTKKGLSFSFSLASPSSWLFRERDIDDVENDKHRVEDINHPDAVVCAFSERPRKPRRVRRVKGDLIKTPLSFNPLVKLKSIPCPLVRVYVPAGCEKCRPICLLTCSGISLFTNSGDAPDNCDHNT